MANFPGGSAYTMARDIAAGYFLVNERTFQRFGRGELQKLHFELDRLMREIRGEQPPIDDFQAVQARQRRMQRLRTAAVVLRNYRSSRRI